mgnify:CR=1 FL=1
MKEPPNKKYLDQILQNSELTHWAKKIFINPTSNKVSRLNSLCYTIATDCNFPFLKPEDRDILLHQLETHFTPKKKTDVIDKQYIHDQYFLGIINDADIAQVIALRIKKGLPILGIVERYIQREFNLVRLDTPTLHTLINLLFEYYTPKPITAEEPITMSNNAPKFETKQFVNGVDAKFLTDNELITAIKDIEKEIAQLQEVKTASKKITAKINELDAARVAIAELLDQR